MSASPEQIAANRQNAALSTGPRSESGKQTSSQNRTSHGLTATRMVLRAEDQAKFDELLIQLESDYSPQTILERQLCLEITESFWRLQRAAQLETDLFDAGDDFLAIADALDKLRRYRTSIEREWHKSIDQLIKLQGIRRKPESAEKPKPRQENSRIAELMKQYLFAPMPGRDTARNDEIGFVSQNAETPVEAAGILAKEAA